MGLYFPDSKDMPFISCLFLFAVYGYLLQVSTVILAKGRKMLLLLYGPGFVGGIVIPVIKLLPKCIVLLASGIGNGEEDRKKITKTVQVGMGVLLGTNISFLTFRYSIPIFFGLKDLVKKKGKNSEENVPKLSSISLYNSGVHILHEIPNTTKFLLLSTFTYFLIQIPAYYFLSKYENSQDFVKSHDPWILTGLISSILLFIIYCIFAYFKDKDSQIAKLAQEQLRIEKMKLQIDKRLSAEEYQEFVFKKHDRDNTGYIEASELKDVLKEMGIKADRYMMKHIIEEVDVGNELDGDKYVSDGKISLNEFKTAVKNWMREAGTTEKIIEDKVNLEYERKITHSSKYGSNFSKKSNKSLKSNKTYKTAKPKKYRKSETFEEFERERKNYFTRYNTNTKMAYFYKEKEKENVIIEDNDNKDKENNVNVLNINEEESIQLNSEISNSIAQEPEQGKPQNQKEEDFQNEKNKENSEKEKEKEKEKENSDNIKDKEHECEYDHSDEENEEEEEIDEPESYVELSDWQLLTSAIFYIITGGVLVWLFSGPLIDIIINLSNRMSIDTYYVSFIIGPFILNSRGVIGQIPLAKKKTTNSISIILYQNNGHVAMNNTLALSVFLFVVYLNDIRWGFNAEVTVFLFVNFIVGMNLFREVIRLWQAILFFSLYPISLIAIFLLKKYTGLGK